MIARPFWRSSIAFRLPIIVGGLSLVVALAITWAAYAHVRATTLEAAGQRLHIVAGELIASSQVQSRALERRTRAWAAEPVLRAWLRTPGPRTEAPARARLRAIASADTAGRAWQLISDGDTLTHGIPPPLAPAMGPLLESAARRPDSVAIGPMGAVGDTIVYPVAALAAGDGRWRGAVVHWRSSFPNRRGRDQIVALIGEGAILVMGSRDGAWSDLVKPGPPPPVDLARDSGVVRVPRDNGDVALTVVRSLTTAPWYIVLSLPQHTVLAPARSFLGRLTAAALVLTILAILVAWWQGRLIATPLHEFTQAALSMTSANYATRVNVPGTDELAQLAVTFNAMAERVEDEVNARFRAELQWRNVFVNNPQPMWVVEIATLKFLAVNGAVVRHYGWAEEELLEMTLDDIRPPEEIPRLHEAFSKLPAVTTPSRTWRHRRKDGSEFDVEISSSALIFDGKQARLTLAQDVTARIALEGELRQAQKMEAVGRLAAGVAHDFNNVLAVILTYAELLKSDLPAGDMRGAELDEIMRAARHAGTLTRQLLAFSRQQVVRPAVLDLGAVVRGLEGMIRPLLGEDIELVLRLEAGPSRVSADPSQLEQVLLNLAINARDAMPGGGRLSIETGSVAMNPAIAQAQGLAPGRYVTLAVRDTGVGMNRDVLARVFEPFFTTKGEGKGTGLGLATVYGIVAQAGGRVDVESAPGAGAMFLVYLPQVDEAPAEPEAPPRPAAPPAGSGTILVADDEPAVLGVVSTILRRNGYQVLSAPSGKDAIALASAHEGPIHLLVSDIVMPGVDGPTLLARLRDTRPGLRAMFMSGYAGDALRGRELLDTGTPFLEKPFTMAALMVKVREALG